MLSIHELSKTYPTPAGPLAVLRGVTLELRPGEAVAVLGPSGSGKSTLLNVLGTLEPPSGGHIDWDGCDPFALAERELARFRNQRIGFVFQEHHLLPQCSVLENVLVPTLAGPRDANCEEHARQLLAAVGLEARLAHAPAELSGGERQRVALARALINRPQLVLADEPTGNLDRHTAERVGELLLGLPAAHDVMLVIVTHSEGLARGCARRLDLVDGTLVPRSS
jgi:lipoprotein-releasing system ATP-binding protein